MQRFGSSGTKPILTLDLPAALAPRVLHALRADAKSVDLRLLAQGGFYGLVGRVGELFEVEDVADVVGEVRFMFLSFGTHILWPCEIDKKTFLRISKFEIVQAHEKFRHSRHEQKPLRITQLTSAGRWVREPSSCEG